MLKSELVAANNFLSDEKLVELTWGNVSCRSEDENLIYIKPSGVPFEELDEDNISIITLDGVHVGGLKPSVDTPTHLELYKSFSNIKSVVHTHSKYCTIFAQSKTDIPCLGTTHADYFPSSIKVVPDLSKDQVLGNFEKNTGLAVASFYKENNIDYLSERVVLLPSHGVFAWGDSIKEAINCAFVAEKVAEMAYKTIVLSNIMNKPLECDTYLIEKHFNRKNSNGKYYGQ